MPRFSRSDEYVALQLILLKKKENKSFYLIFQWAARLATLSNQSVRFFTGVRINYVILCNCILWLFCSEALARFITKRMEDIDIAERAENARHAYRQSLKPTGSTFPRWAQTIRLGQ